MIARLLLSAALSGAVWAYVIALTSLEGGERVFVLGVTTLLLGYHRELFLNDPPSFGAAPQLPTHGRMHVRYRIWGVPLAAARRVHLGLRARERATKRPTAARLIEVLPIPLAWLLRKTIR